MSEVRRSSGSRLIFLVLMVALFAACTPAQSVTVVYHTLTPVNEQTPSATPTPYKPYWEIIPTETLGTPQTLTASPTETPAPPTSTPVPRPQLDTYFPATTDLSMCLSFSVSVGLSSATLNCSLKTYGGFSIAILPAERDYTTDALLLPTNLEPIKFPVIASGSSAGKNDTGDQILAQFYKKRVKVIINYSTPKIPVVTDSVVKIARIVEEKLPERIDLPYALTFPEQPNLKNASKYFTDAKLSIFNKNTFTNGPDFPRNGQVCVYIAPLKTEREKLWTAVLFNQQTGRVERKMMFSMFANRICGGLEPTYTPKDPFKAGDHFEIRLAVNDEWVVTFPLETK